MNDSMNATDDRDGDPSVADHDEVTPAVVHDNDDEAVVDEGEAVVDDALSTTECAPEVDSSREEFHEAKSSDSAASPLKTSGEDMALSRRMIGRRMSHSSLLSWDDEGPPMHENHLGEMDDAHVYEESLEEPELLGKPMERSNSFDSLTSAPRNKLMDELDKMSASSGKNKRKKALKAGRVRWKSGLPMRRTSNPLDNEELTSSQGESFVGSAKKGIWTKMARKTSVWEEDSEGREDEYGLSHLFHNGWTEIKVSFGVKWRIATRHPHIPLTTLICFLALFTGGVVITMAYAQQYEQSEMNAAINKANEYGKWFSDQLAASALPLFAMSQFISEVPIFQDLPTQIGTGGEPGSAPFRESGSVSHRNVTGICDDPLLLQEFNRIAKNIKDAARMDRILVNLQFAPLGVICLLHPLINYEDFDEPNYLNNTGAVGLDLLKDFEQRAVAEDTVKSGDLVFAGPITLRQCSDCDPVVRQAFIARLPIATKDESFEFYLNDKPYNFWGFATALINWGELVTRSGLIEDFESRNQAVILSRKDKLFDADTGEYYNKSVVLVEAGNLEEIDRGHSANVSLRVTNNEWEMVVSFDDRWEAPFLPSAIGASIALAFIVSCLLMEILVERQAHKNLISEMLPKKAMRKIQRGEIVAESYNIVTVFFSDIVGYTTMSAEMRPIKVMKLLNSFYTEVDRIAERHGVYKIETIGDAYMCVGGCPDRCLGPEGAERVALFALDMIELVKNFRTDDGSQLLVRAGMNSGPAVAGVVGSTRPQYTLFGDAVNSASRMESTSEKMKIQCSDFTYRLLRDAPNYTFDMKERGNVQIKGKGRMNTWWIEGVAHAITSGNGEPSAFAKLFRRNDAPRENAVLPLAGSTASESDPRASDRQPPMTPSTDVVRKTTPEPSDADDSVSEDLLMSDGGDLDSIDSLDPMERV